MQNVAPDAYFPELRGEDPPNKTHGGTAACFFTRTRRTMVWLPVWILPAFVIWLGRTLPAWEYMWACAFAIFFGAKWLTWRRARDVARPSVARSLAYIFLWPGLDARGFLGNAKPPKPRTTKLLAAGGKILVGAALLWSGARRIPASLPLARGWVGLFGLILLLHFGSFELVAWGWQRVGISAPAIMQKPLSARSLSDFWRRWNTGFHQLAHGLVFRPTRALLGVPAATIAVFCFSGLIHELVITVPAGTGYGLPTGYFLLQGAGVILERSRLGGALQLRRGLPGWMFAAVLTAAPAFWLFSPVFVTRVVLPFMKSIGAI